MCLSLFCPVHTTHINDWMNQLYCCYCFQLVFFTFTLCALCFHQDLSVSLSCNYFKTVYFVISFGIREDFITAEWWTCLSVSDKHKEGVVCWSIWKRLHCILNEWVVEYSRDIRDIQSVHHWWSGWPQSSQGTNLCVTDSIDECRCHCSHRTLLAHHRLEMTLICLDDIIDSTFVNSAELFINQIDSQFCFTY